MATRYAVETVFKLIDQFTNPLGAVNKEGKALGNMLKNDLAKAEQTLNAIPAKMVNMGKVAVKMGIGGVAAGLAVATKQFIEYDAAITAAGAKFKDLDVTSADYEKQLAKLGDEARRVAGVTPFSAVDTAGALDKFAMAGFKSSQAMALLEGTTDLAIATNKDLTSAVDMATDAMGAFNLMKDEMGNPLDESGLANNLTHLSDVIAKTTNMANTDMSAWFESVKMGAPTFTALGGSLEDFSAMVGVLANAGIKGGEAGTALRNIMLNLSAPTETASKALHKLGISVYDSAGNMLPILDIMRQFENAFGDTTGLENYKKALAEVGGDTSKVNIADFVSVDQGAKIQSLETIFGKRAIGDFLVLLNEGSASIAEFSNQLANSEGAAKAMAGAIQNSVQGQLRLLSSAASELGFKFVEAFKTQGVGGIQNLTATISSFDPTALINALLVIADIISNLVTGMINMRMVLIPLLAAFVLYKTIIYSVALGTNIYNAALKTWEIMTNIATVAQWALNASLFGCPVVWIIAGIAAIIAVIIAVIAIIKNWGAITEWLSGVWQNVLIFFTEFFTALGAWFTDAWQKIQEFFIGVGEGVLNVITGIKTAVQPFFGYLTGIFSNLTVLWQNLIASFQAGGLVGALKNIGSAILAYLLAPVEKVMSGLTWIPGIGGKIADWQSSLTSFKAELSGGEKTQAAPITQRDAQSIQTERYISQSENNSNVTIGLERGLTAKVSGGAPNVRVTQYHSGGF